MLSNNYLPREEKYPNISQEEFIPNRIYSSKWSNYSRRYLCN